MLFGASRETDAFFAALAAPVYVTTIVVGSLAVVFIPAYVERRAREGAEDAARLAGAALTLASAALAVIAAAGVLLADPIVGMTAPGLDEAARALAARLAAILWPSAVGSGIVALLTAVAQSGSRFGWPAAVPCIGGIANVTLTIVLADAVGIVGAALAWTASLALQALLLLPSTRGWRPAAAHPALGTVLAALVPLLLASVLIRAAIVAERYLGSLLPEGELSHVAYASRVAATVGTLLSVGMSAVIFPRMAEDVAAGDLDALRRRTSAGTRVLWRVVAPATALIVALAQPAMRLLLDHGAFTRADAEAVATLLQLYAPSIAAVGLTAVLGRALYALRAVRLLSFVGAAEGLAYAVYAVALTRWLGAPGIALAFSIYYVGSVLWQALYLRGRLGGGGRSIAPLASTGAAAVLAGIAGWYAAGLAREPLLALALGATVGVGAYFIADRVRPWR